jgi:hypothetical protein
MMKAAALRAVFALLVGAAAHGAPSSGSGFLLNGSPISPTILSLREGSGRPGPGDVVLIEGFCVTLRGSAPYSFWAPPGAAGLLVETQGTREWAAVLFPSELFDRLSPRERRGLWGVFATDWDKASAQALKTTDVKRLCLVVPNGIPEELPANLHYLEAGVGLDQDLSNLRPLRSLRYLSLNGFAILPHRVFDLADVAQNTGLRCLAVETRDVVGIEALARLRALRSLVLHTNVADLSFVRALRSLHYLDVSGAPLEDLAPLSALPAIVRVDANGSAVQALPAQPVPSLRDLRILSTRVSAGALASFRRSNPGCRVADSWQGLLAQALDGVTRIRIRRGPTTPPDSAPEAVEESDPSVVRAVVAGLRVNEPRERLGRHACAGGERLDFYRGEQLAATLSLDHGYLLRWSEWPADVPAESTGFDSVVGWLAERGYPSARRDLELHKADEAWQGRRRTRALSDLPPSLRDAFGRDDFEEALAREVPDAPASARLLLRIAGANNDRHTLEERVLDLLVSRPAPIVRSAVRAALQGSDRWARRGAARLWLTPRSGLEAWRPDDAPRLRAAVLDVLEESRVPYDRETAVARLEEWAVDFSVEEVARRILARVRDPHESVRICAAGAAGRLGVRAAIPDLRTLLEGNPAVTDALRTVPEDETEDVDPSSGSSCPPQVAAGEIAVALAWLGVREIRQTVEARLGQATEYEIALALLGDGARLRPEHFQNASGADSLLAAVEAVARSRGAYGLSFALESSPAALSAGVEVRCAARLHGVLREEQAAGLETLPVNPTLDDLRAWYTRYGEAYAQGVRAKP